MVVAGVVGMGFGSGCVGKCAFDDPLGRKRDDVVEYVRRFPRAYFSKRTSGVLSECVDSEGVFSSCGSADRGRVVIFARGEDGMECGGVSGTGVVERLGSELVKSVLPSSLSSSSQSADIRPRE